jgi:hypothetical protein
MPKRQAGAPKPGKGPRKVARIPEQVAEIVTDNKIVTDKLKSPVVLRATQGAIPVSAMPPHHHYSLAAHLGQPNKTEIPLRLVLPRAVFERLTARAVRENYPGLVAWVQAMLEREAQPEAEGRRRTGG